MTTKKIYCIAMEYYFLLPSIAHFDNNIDLPFLLFNTFEFAFSVIFCTLNNMSTCFIMTSIWKV